MRVIIETQGRVRARNRLRIRRLARRAFCLLAGVPLEAPRDSVTFRHTSRLRERVRSLVHDPFVANRRARAMVLGLVFGTFHVVFALANVALGLIVRSLWTISVGVLVAVLNAGKSYLASGALMGGALGSGPESTESLRRCRNAGWGLALGVIALSGTVARLVVEGTGRPYPGALVYGYAVYALMQVLLAAVNLVRARREELIAIKGVRAFNLACALVSIFALQAVLLSHVAWGSLPAAVSRGLVETALGGIVCLCIMGLGFWLVRAAGTRLARRRGGVA
ncbi:hypothetical protein [Enorma burkinafasonensis]|uniref:hypothetical protein n=1 Tax=Enorma burkinafasonensis TaxID=2590867 RepID=UPI0026F08F54|nr:hypothetical protein [Enorma burkinafasonensis]MCI7730207.1 hypothetical protein [Enorma burkinafasonensis]